jgi:hypothetical protein
MKDEIIDRTLSVIDHLSMHPDSSIHPCRFEIMKACSLDLIGELRLSQSNLTEDEAKKYLVYLEEARKIRESFSDALGVAQSDSNLSYFKAMCIERFGAQEAF